MLIGDCADKKCYGCYQNKADTCELCAGSTLAQRDFRKRDDDSTCNCPDGYYTSSTELDCQRK